MPSLRLTPCKSLPWTLVIYALPQERLNRKTHWPLVFYPNDSLQTESGHKECRSTVREEALYQTMLSAVTPTL